MPNFSIKYPVLSIKGNHWILDIPHQGGAGFTLIETIIAVVIISIVSLASIPAYKNFNNDQVLDSSLSDLKNAFRLAQSRSYSDIQCSNGRPSVSWVVRIDASSMPNTYQIFPYCDTGGGETVIDPAENPPQPINSSLSVVSITGCPSPPAVTDFTFEKRTTTITCKDGSITQNAMVNVSNSFSEKTKSIVINSGGIIGDQ